MTYSFHYPPYNRFIPWREDSDYRIAIVSPVGNGPKGEKGDPLTYSDLTDDDKLDLADVLINKGLEKGDQGDPGLSAYDLAGGDDVWGNIENWFASFDRFPNLSPEDEETWKAWLLSTIPEGAIEDAVADAIDDQLEDIAEDLKDEVIDDIVGVIYPVGSLYFTMADLGETGPSILGFPGNWVQLQDRFLYASTGPSNLTLGNENGEVALQPEQVPLRNHRHAAAGLTFNHVHNEGGDTIVRPFKIRETAHKQRQTSVGSSNATITSFTRQSTPGNEGWGKNDGYDGRAIIFNSLRRNTDNATTAKSSPVKTGGPIAFVDANSAGTGTSKTGIDGSTSYTSLDATENVNIMPPYITVHVWQRTEDSPAEGGQESNSSGSSDDSANPSDGEANYGTI